MHGNEGFIRKVKDPTKMGRAMISSFVETNSKRFPHKIRTMGDGTRETLLVIPSTYKKIKTLYDVN